MYNHHAREQEAEEAKLLEFQTTIQSRKTAAAGRAPVLVTVAELKEFANLFGLLVRHGVSDCVAFLRRVRRACAAVDTVHASLFRRW